MRLAWCVVCLAVCACNGSSWTWVDVPEALCQNGAPTGIGLSPSEESDRLVISFEGGGACFNDLNCETVGEKDGYDGLQFSGGLPLQGRRYFSRNDETNPFKDFSFAYVPYCSGDLHFGSNEAPAIDGKTFVGFRNTGLFLDVIREQLPDPSLVVLMGSSAGGFGALLNWDRAQAAFGDTPVHVLDDSGPTLSPEFDKPCSQGQAREAWNTDASMPADCDECRSDAPFSAVLRHVAAKHPASRVALVSGLHDEGIRGALGMGYSDDCASSAEMPASDFEAGLLQLRESMSDQAGFHSYLVGGEAATLHTWLNRSPDEYDPPGGVLLNDWIEAFIEGSDAFRDVGP